MDVGFYDVSHFDDNSRIGFVLRWIGTLQKHAVDFDASVYDFCSHHRLVVYLRLLTGIY